MSNDTPRDDGNHDCDALEGAERDLKEAVADLRYGDTHGAEQKIHDAEEAIEKAEHHHPREIEVIVDGVPKKVVRGTYIVSAFKALVGVAGDRELDVIRHGTLYPLDDNAEIEPHECEKFVSHARCGGSA